MTISKATRRQFILRAGVAGVGLAAGGTVLSACGGDDDTSSSQPSSDGDAPSTEAVAESVAGTEPDSSEAAPDGEVIYSDIYPELPDKGGQLEILIVGGEVAETLDVFTSVLGSTLWAADPAHDWLMHYDVNGVPQPSLAKGFEVVDDTTLRLPLHDGATFQDGTPVTAADVVAVFEWIADEANGSALNTLIEGVTAEAEEDMTVLLRLDQPDAGILAGLGSIPIVPVDSIATQGAEPFGAGPFIFKEWVQDSFLEYEANPKYWNPAAPRVDTLRFTYFADALVGGQAFLSGEGDYLSAIQSSQVADFQQRAESGEFEVSSYAQGVHIVLPNNLVEPFDDPRVRRAMSLATNRSRMNDQVYFGLSEPMYNIGVVPSNTTFYDDSIAFEQDLDQARELLADAGLADGFTADFLAFDIQAYQDLAVIFQSDMVEIGITLDLTVMELNSFVEQVITNKDYSIALMGLGVDPEPSARVDRYLRSDGASNFNGYNNPDVDQLLLDARATFDTDERKGTYAEVFGLAFTQDSTIIPLVAEIVTHAHRNTTNGMQYRPQWGQRFHAPIMATNLEQ